MDDWRILLYPLGYIPSLAFGLRFLIQWLQSEKEGKSTVTPLFWYLSITGNLLFMLHAFIQVQYPISLIQALNAFLSWRNLSLFHRKGAPLSYSAMAIMILSVVAAVTAAFAIQDMFFHLDNAWTRVPTAPWQNNDGFILSFWWHFWGTLGFILFSTRFWIQWWYSEKAQTSYFPESFWIVSLVGSLFILAYAFKMGDSVNYIGPLIGIIPYVRNLILIRKSQNGPAST